MLALVGPFVVEEQKKIIDAAVTAGVKRFIPSEYGGDAFNDAYIEFVGSAMLGKRAVLDYLKSKVSDQLLAHQTLAFVE